MLALGEELRFRGVAPGESPGGTTPRGEPSGSSVGPEPMSAELQHEGHKRAAPENSFPQAGHLISLWRSISSPALELRLHREVLACSSLSSFAHPSRARIIALAQRHLAGSSGISIR